MFRINIIALILKLYFTFINISIEFVNIIIYMDLKFIITIYIGVVALTIALVTLVINEGNKNIRRIEFLTLIENSQIKKLVHLTIAIFIISILDSVIGNIMKNDLFAYYFIVKIFILFLIFKSIIKTYKSFEYTIKYIVNREFKEKEVGNFSYNNIIKYIENEKKEIKKQVKFRNDFNSYSFKYINIKDNYFFDFKNRYKSILSNEKCYLKSFNFKKLIELDYNIGLKYKKINDLKKQEKNNELEKVVIIEVVPPKDIDENNIVMYIDKKYFDLIKNKEDYFNITHKVTDEKSIVEIEIDEIIEGLIYQIKNDNLLDENKIIKKLQKSYKLLLIGKSDKFLEILYVKINKVSKWNLNFKKNIIIEKLIEDFIHKAIEYNNYEEFERYLILYKNIRIQNLNKEIIENTFRNVDLLEYYINKYIQFDNRNKYLYCIQYIYQEFIKKLIDERKIEDVKYFIDKLFNKRKYKDRFKLKSLEEKIKNYKDDKNKDRFEGLDISNLIKNTKENYKIIYQTIVRENLIFFGIINWLIYLYKNEKIEDKYKDNILTLIAETLQKFEYFYCEDFIKILFFIKKEENIIVSRWNWWESYEPQNKNTTYTPILDEEVAINILFLNSYIKDSIENSFKIIDEDKYINKNNVYIFQSIKTNMEKIQYTDYKDIFEKLNINNEDFNENKENNLKLVEELENTCIEKQKVFNKKQTISKEIIKYFKDNLYDEITKRDDSVIKLFEKNKLIKKNNNSENSSKSLLGYNQILDRKLFLEDSKKFLNSYIKEYSSGIIMAENKKIIDKWNEKSIELNDLDSAIEQFENKKDIIIFTPYDQNKFGYNHITKVNFYRFKDIKINVIINSNIKNYYMVTDQKSLGEVFINKLDKQKFNIDVINEVLQVSLIDYNNDEEELENVLKSPPDWLNKYKNKEEYLKSKCNIKIYESMEYKLSENSIFYKVKV